MDTTSWRDGKAQGAIYDIDEEVVKVSSKVSLDLSEGFNKNYDLQGCL